MNLSEPFIRRPVMTAVLTLSVILFGMLAYLQLPVNDLPVVDYPVIQVNVSYPGAGPETMANNIATPLERQFMQIPGLELVTSHEQPGLYQFHLAVRLDKSIDAAATDVQAAINQAQGSLPMDLPSPPTFRKTNPNDQPILYIGARPATPSRRASCTTTPARRSASASAFCPASASVDVYGTQVGRADQGRSLGAWPSAA